MSQRVTMFEVGGKYFTTLEEAMAVAVTRDVGVYLSTASINELKLIGHINPRKNLDAEIYCLTEMLSILTDVRDKRS